MYYIFNAERKLIATCNAKPNQDDLASRNEFSVQSDLVIPFEKVGLDNNGKVVQVEETTG